MKKILFIVLIVLAAILLLTLAYVLLHKGPTSPSPSNPNPFSFTSSSTGTTNGQSLTLTDGTMTPVPDFLPKTQPDWANATYGYQVTQDDTKPYSILYYPNDSSFLISLTEEPLSASRYQAQSALQDQLHLTKEQMCKLNVRITTSISINETYAGQNLGVSYCQGAVQLPD